MFKLGNFNIDEILWGVAQDFDTDVILYAVDQLMNASIEVSAESTDITDKKGNVVRTIYTSKTGTLNSTSAFLHPAVMNAGSGSEIQIATNSNPITDMPEIKIVNAGATANISDATEGTVYVIGIYKSGGNKTYTAEESAAMVNAQGTFTAPAGGGEDDPVQFLVRYERNATDGAKLSNDAYTFPSAVKLTLFCSYIEPCAGDLLPCYVVAPNFTADPNMTISLDRETQEVDFNGNLNVDFCGTDRVLYYIYFPGDNRVVTATGDNVKE